MQCVQCSLKIEKNGQMYVVGDMGPEIVTLLEQSLGPAFNKNGQVCSPCFSSISKLLAESADSDETLSVTSTISVKSEACESDDDCAAPVQRASAVPVQCANDLLVPRAIAVPVQRVNAATVQHAIDATVQHAIAAPVQRASAVPGKPASAVPGKPASAVPGKRANAVPVQRVFAAPVQRASAVPVQRVRVVPVQRDSAVPVQRASAVPVQRARVVPVQRARVVLGKRANAAPVQRASAVPVQRASAVPVQRARIVPVQRARVVPGKRANAAPGQRAIAVPVQCASAAPVSDSRACDKSQNGRNCIFRPVTPEQIITNSEENVHTSRPPDSPPPRVQDAPDFLSSPMRARPNKRPLDSNEKTIALNMYKFLQKQMTTYPYKTEISQQVAEVMGISSATIKRILTEYKRTGRVKTPPPPKPRATIERDQGILARVKQIVHRFEANDEPITARKVYAAFRQEDSLTKLSKTTMYRVLKILNVKLQNPIKPKNNEQ